MLADAGRNYLEKIAYLAYFFFQLHEEHGGDGHSSVINLVNPSPRKVRLRQLRAMVLHGFVKHQSLSITRTAVATAKWLRHSGFATEEIADESMHLQEICRRYEQPPTFKPSVRDLRRCMRLVRLLWLMHAHRVGAHSRVIQFFFPDQEILIGRSSEAPALGYHPEHVVPCAYIRDLAFKRFRERPLVVGAKEDALCASDMCSLIDRLMNVAHISKEQAKWLDQDGGLKTAMPPEWDPDTGDILDRLREIPDFNGWHPA